MTFIIGRKLKMTQLWKDSKVIPVTVVKAVPNTVTLLRTKERDGYEAVQLGDGKTCREARIGSTDTFLKELKVGDTITVGNFKEGDLVQISGTSKGKGFQGVVKRHGFRGGPKTHGQKNRLRAPGSIGSTAPQRVLPGRRMPGRMGGDRVTIKNLEVVSVDEKENLLYLRGAVPGVRGGLLEIKKLKSKESA